MLGANMIDNSTESAGEFVNIHSLQPKDVSCPHPAPALTPPGHSDTASTFDP